MADENRLSVREFFTDIRAVITSPRWRFPIIHDRQALWGSIVLLLVPAYFPLAFVGGVYFRRDPFPGYSAAVPALIAVVVLLLKLGCIHWVARIFQIFPRRGMQGGSFRELVVVFGYTGIPVILATAGVIAMFLVLPGGVGYLFKEFRVATISVFVAAGISFFVWNMIISVLALRTVYPLRDWKLVATLLLGPLLGGALPAILGSSIMTEGKIEAASMRPLLADRVVLFFEPGDTAGEDTQVRVAIHVDRLAYRFHAPERFDLVAFAPARHEKSSHPHTSVTIRAGGGFVGDRHDLTAGRIVGIPGDTVELSGGRLVINGQVWAEPYIRPEFSSADSLAPVRLGASEYLVLPEDRRKLSGLQNDNRVISRDRVFGRFRPTKVPFGWWWWHDPTAFLTACPAQPPA